MHYDTSVLTCDRIPSKTYYAPLCFFLILKLLHNNIRTATVIFPYRYKTYISVYVTEILPITFM